MVWSTAKSFPAWLQCVLLSVISLLTGASVCLYAQYLTSCLVVYPLVGVFEPFSVSVSLQCLCLFFFYHRRLLFSIMPSLCVDCVLLVFCVSMFARFVPRFCPFTHFCVSVYSQLLFVLLCSVFVLCQSVTLQ